MLTDSWNTFIPENVREIYKHYDTSPHLGNNPALICIDLYNISYYGGSFDPALLMDRYPSSCGKYAADAIEPTKKLIQHCRNKNMPVIYFTRNWQQYNQGVNSTQRKRRPATAYDYAIRSDFAPKSGDKIFYKTRASIFFETGLEKYLLSRGIDSLVYAGVSTSGCVRASTVDAFNYGYRPILIEECVFDANPISHAISMWDMHHKYGHVCNLDTYINAYTNAS
jgi:nicotinamidase-related amidase